MKNLSDILPLFGVEHDVILSKMGDITIAFALELPEIFTLSNTDYEAFHQAWVKAIKVLPEGCVLHKQDWYTTDVFNGDFEKEHSFLSHSSERFFHERPYLDHSCYLMLTMRPKERRAVNSMFSSLLRKHIVPVETLDPAFAKSFEGVCSQFIKILSDSGFVRCTRLTDEALVSLVNRYLLLSDDGVLRDLSFENGIAVGEKHCTLFSLGDADHLPAYCGARIDYEKYSSDTVKFPVAFVSPLGLLLPCNHIYNQYVFIEDTVTLTKQLESKKRRLQSLSAYSRENAYGKEAVELFLNEAVANQYQPVRAHFNVLAWADDVQEIQHIRNLCSSALTQIDVVPKIETVGAPQIFWAGIPGNASDFPMNDSFISFSAPACCFFNLETNYFSSLSPVGIRLGDRITGMPVHVDLSDEPMRRGWITNRNKLIIGPSGSGKSFLDNHMVRCYYEQRAHIVIVDSGNSYQGLCELVGGTYMAFTEEKPLRTNPFHIGVNETLDTEKKESLKTLLIALWKQDDDSFNRSEYVALSNALQLYYQKEIPFRCFNSFYEFLEEDFVTILKTQSVKEKDFDVANFLYVLRPFYKGGEFDYLLNATENLDLLNQRFIVFELDNIKDHPILFPVVTIILMDVSIAKMRKLEGIRKILLLEEMWQALAKANMESAIQYWVKTIRKYFGELWPVSQDIEDMIGSSVVKNAIINNCDTKILLDQSKYQNRFEEVQALLGLTDKERVLALSINKSNDPARKYKEVFISMGGRAKVYRVETSTEEYLAYTTEQSEKLKVKNAAAQYGGIQQGILSITQNY